MVLEERTIEQLPDRCQNCGAPLTEGEKATIVENPGMPALCTTCAAERVSLDEEAAEGEEL